MTTRTGSHVTRNQEIQPRPPGRMDCTSLTTNAQPWRRHAMETLSAPLAFVRGILQSTDYPYSKPVIRSFCVSYYAEQAIDKSLALPVICQQGWQDHHCH